MTNLVEEVLLTLILVGQKLYRIYLIEVNSYHNLVNYGETQN